MGEQVSWLELALDFQAATHVDLCHDGDNGEKITGGKRALFFASESRRMAVICRDTLAPVEPFANNQVRVLSFLGLPSTGRFPIRPRLLNPAVVNHALLQVALKNTNPVRLCP